MADVTDTLYSATDAMVGYGNQWLIGDGATGNLPGRGSRRVVRGRRRNHGRDPDDASAESGPPPRGAPGMITSAPFRARPIFLPQSESQSYAGGGTGSFVNGGLAKIAETGEVRSMKLRFREGNSPEGELAFRGYIAEFSPAKGITVEGVITTSVSVMPVESFLAGLPAWPGIHDRRSRTRRSRSRGRGLDLRPGPDHERDLRDGKTHRQTVWRPARGARAVQSRASAGAPVGGPRPASRQTVHDDRRRRRFIHEAGGAMLVLGKFKDLGDLNRRKDPDAAKDSAAAHPPDAQASTGDSLRLTLVESA